MPISTAFEAFDSALRITRLSERGKLPFLNMALLPRPSPPPIPMDTYSNDMRVNTERRRFCVHFRIQVAVFCRSWTPRFGGRGFNVLLYKTTDP